MHWTKDDVEELAIDDIPRTSIGLSLSLLWNDLHWPALEDMLFIFDCKSSEMRQMYIQNSWL